MIQTVVPAGRHLPFIWGTRTYVMGIVNLSPDSFSGDGLASADAASAQATRMVAEGADIIDIGGASTRPGAPPVFADKESERVVPVIARLHRELKVPLSIDTCQYEVARAAVAAGATILNDIHGLKEEARLACLAAEYKLPIIVTANERSRHITSDIMTEVISDLKRAMRCCRDAGVPPENVIVDPGIGFGKTASQNLDIIRRLEELKVLGCPLLLGPSRKSFIGDILGLPERERLEGTAAAVALGIAHGADIIRVHDVKEMVRVARLSDAVIRAHP